MGRAKVAIALLLSGAATAGCLRLISAEQLEDGSAVFCAKVEPPPAPQDAGPDAVGVSSAPAMRYVPVHAPVGTVTP